MAANNQYMQQLLIKLRTLTPERVAEVEDFIDFLKSRDQERHLTQAAVKTAEPSSKKIWDNPDDAIYDRL